MNNQDTELDDEPCEDDAYLTPSGSLGGMTALSIEGKFIGEWAEENDAVNAFKEWCEKNQFRPNIWYVSDHGNVSLYTLEEGTPK